MKKPADLDECMLILLDENAEDAKKLLEAEGRTMHPGARQLLERFLWVLGYAKCPCPACKRSRGIELLPDELEYEKILGEMEKDLQKIGDTQ